MSKETILKEFDKEFTNSPINFSFIREEIRQSLSKAIDQTKKETREETIKEIEKLLLENLRYDEYVLYGETGYITEIKIKDILNKLKN